METLQKYNNEFLQKLNEQLAVYVTIGGKKESPMWFQYAGINREYTAMLFKSSQVDYMFFEIALSDQDKNIEFAFNSTYDHFRELKYNHIKEHFPSVYYEVRKTEKPEIPLPIVNIEATIKNEMPQVESAVSTYEQQAIDFMNKNGLDFECKFLKSGKHFSDDKVSRDIYYCIIRRLSDKGEIDFNFGQSIANSGLKPVITNKGTGIQSTKNIRTAPTAYDLLACITKNDPGNFEDFCSEFGYDEDSRKAEKIYNSVVEEWENVEDFFTKEEIEQLQEIQ